MHGAEQPHQAQIVVTVEVADENVVDALGADAKTPELQLGAFSAIDQVKMPFHIHQLRGLVSAVCRGSSIGTQYFDTYAQGTFKSGLSFFGYKPDGLCFAFGNIEHID